MPNPHSHHLSHSAFGIVRILLARSDLETEQVDQLLGWEPGHSLKLLEDPASAALSELFDLFQLVLGDFEPTESNPQALPRAFYNDPTFHRVPLPSPSPLTEDSKASSLHLLAFILRIVQHLQASQTDEEKGLEPELQALLLEYYRVLAPYIPEDEP